MFVVRNLNRGVRPLHWQRPCWCAPGGAGWWCRRGLVAEDVQPLNVGAVPRVMRPDILCNQGAQCVEREVVELCLAWRRCCAEGMRPSAKLAGMKVRDAPAPEAVQLLGAAAAEVMPKERDAVLVRYLPADAARAPRPRMWSFTVGHPEERYGSWDVQVTVGECASFGAVRCGGRCSGIFLVVAVCPCVWLGAGLRLFVIDEEVVIHTAVVGGLLCFLCVHLDAVLSPCVCSLDGGELHVTYCRFGFWSVVGDDPVELQRHRSPEHPFLDLRLPD